MTDEQANNECRSRDQRIKESCGNCRQVVLLHCYNCQIQVTGCLCTEVDRFGQDEAWNRAVDRLGEELARERYRTAGLYVPEVN